jgi:N-methylhydantoinase B
MNPSVSVPHNRLGPVQLEILHSAITAVAEEMSIAVRRTSRSTTVREMLDYSTAIFDGAGRNVAQSTSSPMALTLAPCLEQVLADHLPPDDWEAGDVVILNDPYCGSQHLPDIVTFRAVFVNGERIAFTGAMAHHVDVGGSSPGSYDMTAREIFAEGLRIPPLKIRRQGRIAPDLMKLILRNVRQPEILHGDLMSQIASLDIGAAGLERLAAKYGADTLVGAGRQMIEHADAAMRKRIAALPAGRYSFDDHLDDDGVGEQPIRVAVDCEIAAAGIVFDFSRSDAQVPVPINCTRNVLVSAVNYAVIAALGEGIPVNSGCCASVSVVAPLGRVVNAASPAPVVNRMTIAHRIVNAVMGALAQALPERIPAAYYGVSYVCMLESVLAGGERRIYFDSEVGGWGAAPHRDGANAFSCGLHNIAAVPIEMLEAVHPIQFTTYTLRADSAGAGRHRGGLGLIREWRLVASEGRFAATFDRFTIAPYGLRGGAQGATGRLWLVRADGTRIALRSKLSDLCLRAGDTIRIETSGGGGHGPPAARDPEAIAADIAEGYVTPEAAIAAYGDAATGGNDHSRRRF